MVVSAKISAVIVISLNVFFVFVFVFFSGGPLLNVSRWSIYFSCCLFDLCVCLFGARV